MPAASDSISRGRPLSQQLAPAEQTLHSQNSIARDELKRKSTRHQTLPEKVLPEYHQPEVATTEQYRPEGPSLSTPEPEPLGDTYNRRPEQHRPLPAREVSTLPRSGEKDPLIPGGMKHPKQEEPSRDPGQVTNGDLPHDQLIPLDELPVEEQPVVPEVADQPVFRRPKRRQTPRKKSEGYNSRTARCLGIILIIIGILEIIANCIGIPFQTYRGSEFNIVFYLAPGFWCSIFFILCGVFGVVSADRRSTWAIVTHLVTATLAAVFACILLAMCGWGLFLEVDRGYHLASLILWSLMAFGGLIALPITIWASVLCCQVFCQKPPATESKESSRQDIATVS